MPTTAASATIVVIFIVPSCLQPGKRWREGRTTMAVEFFQVAPTETIEITRLLRAWGGGDQAALDQLAPLVYGELRRVSRRYMRRERAGHTLQTTALVNEVYLRLVNVAGVDWKDRAHFFAVSAQMMRRILVDSARARASARRKGGIRASSVNLDQVPDLSGRGSELIALDDALNT